MLQYLLSQLSAQATKFFGAPGSCSFVLLPHRYPDEQTPRTWKTHRETVTRADKADKRQIGLLRQFNAEVGRL
jgi:hypothetical protein